MLLGVLDTASLSMDLPGRTPSKAVDSRRGSGVECGEGAQSRYTSVPEVPREPKLQPS